MPNNFQISECANDHFFMAKRFDKLSHFCKETRSCVLKAMFGSTFWFVISLIYGNSESELHIVWKHHFSKLDKFNDDFSHFEHAVAKETRKMGRQIGFTGRN